ncbi:MAG: sigma-70 family RNA polymerase sigma factor [Planctomycetota bacterium]|nr:sigma-70 family RNA polymerase sigma factor [Planctomycetota bacterium]MDA0919031.1 sigma-70 family RNA polymerase sigma factor [Planctomycetota bacterium]MDA1159285.1 sigma-70 family RNA polymerase sigma factor [Planctomycetota bacterium]
MATHADSGKTAKDTVDTRSAIRLSLAACALVVATSAAEPSSAQAATGMAAAATAVVSQVSESVILKNIRAYCSKSWQNAGISHQEWSDCTQQVFARLLERVDRDRMLVAIEDAESPERRELNRAIWATSQRSRREKRYSSLEFAESQSENHDPWPAKMESLAQIKNVLDGENCRLSPTQREIVARWSDGESISAIAESLKLSPARISDEKYKAIQKLRQHFGTDARV